MLDDSQAELGTAAPLFSIIIPLEDHRSQWERCWQGWQSQTLDSNAYEIILMVPPDFPRDRLRVLEGAARLEYSQHSHDIGLCADGAALALGKYLFFTESHCWPEPDVLAQCLQAFGAHADWAAFSGKTVRVCRNRLSEAEADMYEADAEFGRQVHPWRKILDACFVTRRDAYEDCGGFNPQLGHFAEWALAASYFESGHKVGYLANAITHHYYIGSFAELKAFTLDFVQGEIRYFSLDGRAPDESPLQAPPEFVCQGNFDRDMARAILRMILLDRFSAWTGGDDPKPSMPAILRWAGPAIAGDSLARGAAAARELVAYLATMPALVLGSRERLSARFKRYIAALIARERLRCLRTERLSRGRGDATTASGDSAAILDRTGFYPLEKFQGHSFRWSESAAAIRLRGSAGRSVRIKCVPVRTLSDEIDLRFYFDGQRIADGAVSRATDNSEIRIDLPRSGAGKLGWICRPFPARADSRNLGLPIMCVEFAPPLRLSAADSDDSAVASPAESV